MSSPITTHVLDTSSGRPAADVRVQLERRESTDGTWSVVGRGTTNADGRVTDLTRAPLEPGVYQITFDTAGYFARRGVTGFYPFVPVVFQVRAPDEHYHVPLLLNPFGYSTYRGS